MKPNTDFIFQRCRRLNTQECPQTKTADMQLAILNDPYFEFLSDDTTTNIQTLCEECKEFEPTWRSIGKYT